MRVNNFEKVNDGNTNTTWGGDLILKRGRLIRLAWPEQGSNSNVYTVIRPMYGLNPDDPTNQSFDPLWIGDYFGAGIMTLPVVRNVCPNIPSGGSKSFILVDRLDYQPNFRCPYTELWFALKRAQKENTAKPEWKDLLIPGKYGNHLPQWGNVYFMNVLPFHADLREKDRDKQHPDRDIEPAEWGTNNVLMLTSAAFKKMEKLLRTNLEEARTNNTPPLDIMDPNTGAFVVFWPEKCAGPTIEGTYLKNPPSNEAFKSYEVAIMEKYQIRGKWYGKAPRLNEAYMNSYKASLRQWEDTLNIMSYPQQAEIIADIPQLPPDLLMMAWERHPDWIPSSLRNRTNGLGNVHPAAVAPTTQTASNPQFQDPFQDQFEEPAKQAAYTAMHIPPEPTPSVRTSDIPWADSGENVGFVVPGGSNPKTEIGNILDDVDTGYDAEGIFD